MGKLYGVCVLTLLLLSAASVFGVTPVAAQNQPYRLNPGDMLEISVWKEEGMQKQVLILPDGSISFPLAGHVSAAGNTAEEVQRSLVKKISVYIPEPVVTVSVVAVTGNAIYVIGQVKNPGRFPVTRQVDVMQALSLAGGLTPFGNEGSIRILRRVGGKQQALAFDYSAVKKGRNLETNILLEPGDVVVVPD